MHSLLCALQFSVLFSVVLSVAINKTVEKETYEYDKVETPRYIGSIYNDSANEENGSGFTEEILNKSNVTTNITTEGSESYNPKPKCRMCTVREEQKKHRIEIIKNRISHALKLDILGMPNATRNRLPKVPSFLRLREKYEKYERNENMGMQKDSPSYAERQRILYEQAQEEYGQPERTYSFAKEPPEYLEHSFPNTIYFDVPLSPEKEANKALLWVYINDASVFGRNITEIYVYAIYPPGKSGGPPIKKEIGRRKRHYMKGAGWHHFNIISEVKKWNEKKELNLGIIVEALDEEKKNMIVMPSAVGRDEGYEPLLDIRTSLKKTKRAKRSTDLYCDDREEIACCRYPLEVDFIEFGWDFVIAPLKYAAYYCAGECNGENLEDNIHTHVINQATIPTRAVPASATNNVGPCCTPTHMSDLAMLFFDHNSNVEYTTLPRMRVDRCGCA